MTSATLLPPPAGSSLEAGSLAFELAKARDEWLAYQASQRAIKPDQDVLVDDQLVQQAREKRIMSSPPQSTSWLDLDQLAAQDPELAARRWEEVKIAARKELASGHWAAAAMETANQYCWQRAQFLVLRDDLASQWRPRNGIEWCLIDGMTQALVMQRHWMQRLIEVDSLEWPEPPSADAAKFQPPRLSSSMAIDQAAAMVDRFNRIFMRGLRQLRDLRRYTVSISAQQVNIAHQQQVNVAATPEGCDEGDKPPVAILDAGWDGRADDRQETSDGNGSEGRVPVAAMKPPVTLRMVKERAAAIKAMRAQQ